MVIGVRGAVRAVVAVDTFARVAVVSIGLEIALGHLEVGLWDNLIKTVRTAA